MADGVVTIPIPGRPRGGDESAPANHGGPAGLGEFFAGPENCLVEPAVQGVLTRRPAAYNPLAFCGGSGTGKSHLARGLAAAWKDRFPGSRVIYATAVDFARELADAFESQSVEDFRARYRGAALLVLEDVAELAGRPAAQDELIHTLDAVVQQGGQVVVTARAVPTELDDLSPALQSRLSAGLAVPLVPPSPATRLAVLQQWAKLRELKLAGPVLQLLADGLDGTVPELVGAMLQLEAPAREDGTPLAVPAVRKFLAERDSARQLQLRKIAATTARYFSLRLADLRGPGRRRPVVIARDVAMFLARLLTKESLQRIGGYFGGRDHTTVMHACRKTAERIQLDPAIRQAVEQLRRQFRGP